MSSFAYGIAGTVPDMQNKGGSRQRASRRFACAPCPIESVVKRCWVSSGPVVDRAPTAAMLAYRGFVVSGFVVNRKRARRGCVGGSADPKRLV
jgi:hypothetical protein